MCSTKPEPSGNEAEHNPINEVKLADETVSLEKEIGDSKTKLGDIEGVPAPLRGDVEAIGKGTMEAMAALEDAVTRTHTALCSTIDMVQEVQVQLDGTQEKLAHLEDSMGELHLAEVAENVSQLLTSTKNTNGEIKTLNTVVAGLDRKFTDNASRAAHLFEDVDGSNSHLDNRCHDVCQKDRRFEKQVDEMAGLREKVANQEAKILAQDEKINALEQKLERFAAYVDNKMDAIEEETRRIPKIQSRLVDWDNDASTHSIDIERIRHEQIQTSTNIHRRLDDVDSHCARIREDVEQCAQKSQTTEDVVRQHRDEKVALEKKMEEMIKGQVKASCAIEKVNTAAGAYFDIFNEKITKLNDRTEEVAENNVIKALYQEISSLDEKLEQFAEGYDRSVRDCDTRFDQVYQRLSAQEGFEDIALKKFRKLEMQSEIVPYLQAKVTKLEASTTSALKTLDAGCRQESTRVNAKLTLLQNESKTLFKSVDNLDRAIGVAKKKIVELDQDGPAVIPKAIVQVWKDFQSIKMQRYFDFEEFKSIFVFYAKATGVPEHAWKADMHSRVSTRVQNATIWLLERNDSFDDFCRQLGASVQRVRTV